MAMHLVVDGYGQADTSDVDDRKLVATEYWPSTGDEAQQGDERPRASWWEQTNWFRVQEKRQLEQGYEQQQRARGLPAHPPARALVDSGRPSYTVSHPLHDDDDAPVEYGGLSEDGSQLGERYSGKAMRGVGSNLGSSGSSGSGATNVSAPLSEKQRLASAPGGAEVFCRFNTSSTRAPSVVMAQTAIAVAKPASSGAPPTTTTAAPSLMQRSDPVPKPAVTATVAPKKASTRMRLASIQGYDAEAKRKLHELVVLPLFHPSLFSSLGVRPARGVILAGASGVGKSNLIKSLVHELGHSCYFQHVDGAHLLTELQGDLSSYKAADSKNMESTLGIQSSGTGLGAPREHGTDVLSKLFGVCRKNAPALLFIDELDVIASERKTGEQPLHAKIRALLKLNMDRLSESATPVVVIGATNHPEVIDKALLRTGRFDRLILLNKPDRLGRLEILRHCTRNMRMDARTREADLQTLADNTEGFVGSDLANLCTETGLVCIREFLHEQAALRDEEEDENDSAMGDGSSGHDGVTPVPLYPSDPTALASLLITRDHFFEALKTIKPSSSRSFGMEALRPVQWQEVGGAKEIKTTLLETIEAPLLFPHLFSRYGLAPSSGCLLYGPPGCGKTLMARAIASRAKASFLSVKGPELLSSYLGESEANVRKIFAQARAASPCVLFFDEIDSIALSRSAGLSGGGGDATGDRVLNQLLLEMDTGIVSHNGAERNAPSSSKPKDQTTGGAAPAATTPAPGAATAAAAASGSDDAVMADATAAPAASPRSRAPVPTPSRSAGPIVFVVAATNRPDLLDPALMRPGRLDQLLFVGLPNAESRLDIMRTLLSQTPCEDAIVEDDYAVLRRLAEGPCRGLSGADLAHMCNRARKYAIHAFLQRTAGGDKSGSGGGSGGGGRAASLHPLTASDRVTLAHLERALSETHPSVSEEVLEKYRLFNEQIKNGGRITTVNDVDPSEGGGGSPAPSPRASPAQLDELRESFRQDIASKLATLGPEVNAQQALNQILGSLLQEANKGTYRQSNGSSSSSSSSAAAAAAAADVPVSLASSNASQVPARPPKTGGRQK